MIPYSKNHSDLLADQLSVRAGSCEFLFLLWLIRKLGRARIYPGAPRLWGVKKQCPGAFIAERSQVRRELFLAPF